MLVYLLTASDRQCSKKASSLCRQTDRQTCLKCSNRSKPFVSTVSTLCYHSNSLSLSFSRIFYIQALHLSFSSTCWLNARISIKVAAQFPKISYQIMNFTQVGLESSTTTQNLVCMSAGLYYDDDDRL